LAAAALPELVDVVFDLTVPLDAALAVTLPSCLPALLSTSDFDFLVPVVFLGGCLGCSGFATGLGTLAGTAV
jgi:hypothetical protein